jgi:TonB-dependent SusC/RagA subfamily outer membrane receptor
MVVLSFSLFFDISAQKANRKIIITGKVTDFYNSPVSGALIMIDGKPATSKTNSKGYYKVKVKQSALQIGVFTNVTGVKEIPIDGKKVVNFTLDKYLPQTGTDSGDLGKEVANRGNDVSGKKYTATPGTKSDFTTKEYTSFSDIFEMIRTIPGVMVSGSNVTIRGVQSMGNSSPLFVVNGIVVRSISGINPATVKSIEVLKGPSASVYGVQGANGAIVIQLK